MAFLKVLKVAAVVALACLVDGFCSSVAARDTPPAATPASTARDGAACARGVVYDDLNANGRRDDGEPGVAGVAVSNEREVVVSDAQGRYSLPVAGDATIFITKPAGYRVPMSPDRVPQFYYLHRPAGSPALKYPGSSPTGPLPASIDFPIMKYHEPTSFTAVLLADTQTQQPREVDWLRDDLAAELAGLRAELGERAAFGVVLGDIVFDDLDLLPGVAKVLGRTGMPFYYVPGNHDMNYDVAGDAQALERFRALFGPANYSWDYGRAHFVSLDNIIFKDSKSYEEGLDEAVLTWLAKDLAHVAPDRLIVLCSHAPIVAGVERKPGYHRNTDRLLALLRGRRAVLSVSGHTHLCFFTEFGAADGWQGGRFLNANVAAACGAWWSGPADELGIPDALQWDGVPNGYTLLEVDGADYRLRYKGARLAADRQLAIYPPGKHAAGANAVLVNVFYGSPQTRVEWQLDGGPWQPMQYAPGLDLLAVAYYEGEDQWGKPWLDPQIAEHLWHAELPEATGQRTHQVRVRATQHDGQVLNADSRFEIGNSR